MKAYSCLQVKLSKSLHSFQYSEWIYLIYLLLLFVLQCLCDSMTRSHPHMAVQNTFFRHHAVTDHRTALLRKLFLFKQVLWDRLNKQPFISEWKNLLSDSRFLLLSISSMRLDTCFCKWSWRLMQKQSCLWVSFIMYCSSERCLNVQL